MNALLRHPHRSFGHVRLVLAVILAAGAAAAVFWSREAPSRQFVREATAKRVVNGHYVKLKDDEKLIYLGMRAPYENEPMFRESRDRNEQLVVDQTLRLRYDREAPMRDRKDRLWAYAFLNDGTFVNATLLREGLAYARLHPHVRRFRRELLEAQTEARAARRGLWAHVTPTDETAYPADTKHAAFHRPGCEDATDIDAERRVEFSNKDEAFTNGFCPCNKCRP